MAGSNSQNVPLEHLLQHPLLWSPDRICDFLKKSHKVQTDWQSSETKEQTKEPTRKQVFVSEWSENVDKEAITQKIIDNDENGWKKLLETDTCRTADGTLTHYQIITMRYIKNSKPKQPKKINTTSLMEMAKILRDKYEHSGEIPPNYKASLGWFKENGDVDPHLFVNYWTKRFPKLFVFLWAQFYKFHVELTKEDNAALEDYFPKLGHTQNISTDINFKHEMEVALLSHLESGRLEKRFSTGNNLNLELRTLPVSLILAGNNWLEFQLSNNLIKCHCSKGASGRKSYIEYKIISHASNAQKINVFITAGDIPALPILELFQCHQENAKFVIILGEITEHAAQEFLSIKEDIESQMNCLLVQNPVRFSELETSVQNRVTEACVQFMCNGVVSLKSVFPYNTVYKDSILSGRFLNQLLQNQVPKIWAKYALSPLPDFYKERHLYKCSFLFPSIFNETNYNHYFVIYISPCQSLGEEKEKCSKKVLLGQGISADVLHMTNSYSPSYRCDSETKILLLVGITPAVHDALLAFSNIQRKEGSHLLEFLPEAGHFKWIASQGKIPESFSKSARVDLKLDEKSFLENLAKDKNENTVFIADMPGMGKSMVLKSLAAKLLQMHPTRAVILIDMNEFVDKMNKQHPIDVNSEDVVNVLVDSCCTYSFETTLLKLFLTDKEIKFELMLDGLDEVKRNLIGVALRLIQVIQREIPTIRVWVTLRDYMLPEIATKFYTLGYKMERFSKSLQIEFLRDYWINYRKNNKKDVDSELTAKLNQFAKNCVDLQLSVEDSEITGIPLHCRMIAETNAERVFVMNHETELTARQHHLVELYQQMVERKLKVFVQEKHQLPLEMNSYIVNLIRNDMESSHIYFAISLLISEEVALLVHKAMQGTYESLETVVLQQGIIQQTTPPLFIHRTFAEYYLALFIFKVLAGKFKNRITKTDSYFQNILNNVMSSDTENPKKRQEQTFCKFDFKQPVVCHFLNSLLEGSGESVSSELDLLLKVTDISSLSENNAALSGVKESSYFYALLAQYPNKLPDWFALALFQHKYKFCKYVMENHDPKTWHPEQGFGEEKGGLWHMLLKGYWPNLETKLQKEAAEKFFKFVFEKVPKEFERKDKYGRTPLQYFLDVYNDDFKDKVCPHFGKTGTLVHFIKFFKNKCNANLNIIYNDEMKNNLVIKCVEFDFPDIVIKTLLDCGVDKEYANVYKQTALHVAVKMQNLKLVHMLIADFKLNTQAPDLMDCTIINYNTSMEVRNYIENYNKPRIWLELACFKDMQQICWVYSDLKISMMNVKPQSRHFLKNKNITRTIELRNLPSTLMSSVLNGRTYIEIKVSSLKTFALVYFVWTANFRMYRSRPFVTKEPHTATIIVTNKFSDISVKRLFEWCFDNSCQILHIITSDTTNVSDQRKLDVITNAYTSFYKA